MKKQSYDQEVGYGPELYSGIRGLVFVLPNIYATGVARQASFAFFAALSRAVLLAARLLYQK